MIIYAGIGLLLGLAILTVYALIQLGRNNTLTFFLIPVALVSSIFSGYTMLALQGTPIDGIPEEQVEVIWVEVQKPHIYFNVRPVGELQPVYYRIPYTEDNAKKMPIEHALVENSFHNNHRASSSEIRLIFNQNKKSIKIKKLRKMWARIISRQFCSEIMNVSEPKCPKCKRKISVCQGIKKDNYRHWLLLHNKVPK